MSIVLSSEATLLFRQQKLNVVALVYDDNGRHIHKERKMNIDGKVLHTGECHIFGSRREAKEFTNNHNDTVKNIEDYFPHYRAGNADAYGTAVFVLSEEEQIDIKVKIHEGHDLPDS